MIRRLVPAALALGFLALQAQAGEIADRASEAEQLAQAGKFVEAGDYQVTSVLRDKVTGKSVDFTLPLTMSE